MRKGLKTPAMWREDWKRKDYIPPSSWRYADGTWGCHLSATHNPNVTDTGKKQAQKKLEQMESDY